MTFGTKFMVRREHSGDGEISSVDSSDSSISTRAFTHHIVLPVAINTPTLDGQPRTPSKTLFRVCHDSSQDSPAVDTGESAVLNDGENDSFFAAIGSAMIAAAAAFGSSTTNGPNKRLRTISDLLTMVPPRLVIDVL